MRNKEIGRGHGERLNGNRPVGRSHRVFVSQTPEGINASQEVDPVTLSREIAQLAELGKREKHLFQGRRPRR